MSLLKSHRLSPYIRILAEWYPDLPLDLLVDLAGGLQDRGVPPYESDILWQADEILAGKGWTSGKKVLSLDILDRKR